jgi:hypothetical protein
MKLSVRSIFKNTASFAAGLIALVLMLCSMVMPRVAYAQEQSDSQSAGLTLPPLIGTRSIRSLAAQQREYLRTHLQPFAQDLLPVLANPDIKPRVGQAVGRIGLDQPAPATASVLTSTEQTIDLTLTAYADSTALGGTGLPTVTPGDPTGATVTNTDVIWSETNNYVVFASNGVLDPTTGELEPAASAAVSRFHLFAMYVNGSQINFTVGTLSPLIVQLTFGNFDERYPSLLGQSQVAYCTDDVDGTYTPGTYELVTAPLVATGQLSINQTDAVIQDDTHNCRHPFYRGTSIFYSATDANGLYQIWEDSLPGEGQAGSIEQLTSGPADNDNPNLSDQGYLAWDTNATAYKYVPNVDPPLQSAGPGGTRNIYASAASGVGVMLMSTNSPTTYSTEHPVWSTNNGNPFTLTGTEDLFFDSNRPSPYPVANTPSTYTLYYYSAFQNNEILDEASVGDTTQVNTSNPSHLYADTEPAVSPLTVPYIAVAYISNRYIIDHNYDNPLTLSSLHNPTTVATALNNANSNPPGADPNLDQEPTDVGTVTAPKEPAATEVLISQLEDIDPPALVRYNEGTEEIVHEFAGAYSHAAYQASLNNVKHYIPSGQQITFVVRLSDRQTGVGQAWLQIKDPESAFQDTTGLEHKVFTQRFSEQLHPLVNEATEYYGYDSLFYGDQAGNDGGNPVVLGNEVPIADSEFTLEPTTAVLAAEANAGANQLFLTQNNSGGIADGDAVIIDPNTNVAEILIVSAFTQQNGTTGPFLTTTPTFFAHNAGAKFEIVNGGAELTADVNDGGGPAYSLAITPNTTNNISQFQIGDQVSICDPTSLTPIETAQITNINGNTLVVDKAIMDTPQDNEVNVGIDDNYKAGHAVVLLESTTAFDPIGQEVDCQAIDTSISPVNINGVDQVSGDADSYHIPDYAPGIDDAGTSFDEATTDTGGAPGYWLPLTPVPAQDQDQNGGVLYTATWTTPLDVADYYVDVVAEDASNNENWQIYDNAWGFTTRNFQATNDILVVNDYALPQKFFSREGDTASVSSGRGGINFPFSVWGTESYWTDISNDIADWQTFYSQLPEDQDQVAAPTVVLPSIALSVKLSNGTTTQEAKMLYAFDPGTGGDPETTELKVPNSQGQNQFVIVDQNFPAYANGLGVSSYYDSEMGLATPTGIDTEQSVLATSQKYDIWRILSRGPIPVSILNDYGGSEQIQPADPFAAAPAPITNFVAPKCVVWLSPYSGDTYVGTGTITDPATQTNLEEFLNAGGRLHIEGKDIGYALTDNGAVINDFYDNYLNDGYATANNLTSFITDDVGSTDAVYNLTAGGAQTDYISHDAFINNNGDGGADGFNIFHENFLYPTGNKDVAAYAPPNTEPATIAHYLGLAGGGLDTTDRTDASEDAFNGIASFIDGFNTLATSELTGTTNREAFYETKSAATGDISSIVSYSSFGIATISQQVNDYATQNPGSVYAVVNERTMLEHNIVCTLRTGSITGVVTTTQAGGAAQPGAIVTAVAQNIGAPTPVFTARTDSSGKYVLNGLAAGRYDITAYREGFTFQHIQYAVQDVHGGDTASLSLAITPAPNGSLVVYVVDPNNNPIQGALVTLTDNGGGTAPAPELTDVTGHATFASVQTGLYTVTITKAGYVTYTNTSVAISPGVTTYLLGPTSATPVVLQPQPVTITGEITNSVTGAPIVGATVILVNAQGGYIPNGATGNFAVASGAGGIYTFTIPGDAIPPTTDVYVEAGAQSYATSAPVEVPGGGTVAAGQTYTVNIALVPQATITVTVLDYNTGLPVPGVQITATGLAGTVTAPYIYGPTATDANGDVTFTPVTSGKYTISANAASYSPAYASVKSQTPPNPVTVAPSSTTNVTIELLPATGTLTGKVTSSITGAPISGATVQIVNAGFTYSGTTGATGVYTISNVRDGVYTATASATGYTNGTASVTITTAATTTQNFSLVPDIGSFTGTVTSAATGLPLSGATVSFTANGTAYTTTTNANGVYSFTNVPTGTYQVTAVATLFDPETLSVTVQGGVTITVNFILQRAVIHSFSGGLQMFSVPYDYNNYTLAQILSGSYNGVTGAQNQIAAWLPQDDGYVLTPTPPCDTIHDGQGYWGRFYPTGGLLYAGGVMPVNKAIVLQPGWNMIGDPYTTAVTLASILVYDSTGQNEYTFSAASSPTLNILSPLLYTYDQATNSYVQVSIGNPNGASNPSLEPYAGYWIEAYTTCTLQF